MEDALHDFMRCQMEKQNKVLQDKIDLLQDKPFYKTIFKDEFTYT